MSSKNTPEIITLRPTELSLALKVAAQTKSPVFIWGAPGIGKSDISRQVATEMGYAFEDIRLSQMDPTDIRGIPFPDNRGEDTVMRWSPPSFYNRHKGKQKTLYFFDEMNAAPQSTQAAAYQIVLDRKIGEYDLGPEDVVFAAGNRDTDRGATFKMPTPLMNRFVHLELQVNFEDWQDWALQNNIEASVVAFLSWQKHKLFDFKPTTASRGFQTPRSWARVSTVVKGATNVPENVLTALVAGAVGDGPAIEYITFRSRQDKLPNPYDILTGKITKLKDDQKEISLLYAITIGLCYELRDHYNEAKKQDTMQGGDKNYDAWLRLVDNYFGFMCDNMQPEMAILGTRTVLSNFRLSIKPMKMKNWGRFTSKHNQLILEEN